VQHEWHQFKRGGGFRPIVFMQHPIAVSGMFSYAVAATWWLWRTGAVPRLLGLRTGWWLIPLVGTLILCKTLTGFMLAALGVGLYFVIRHTKTRWVMALIVLLPLVYMGGKVTGVLGDQMMVNFVRMIDEARVGSFEQRLYSERVVLDGMRSSPLLGTGRWAGVLEHADHEAGRRVIPDAYWVIVAGSSGLLGLAAYVGIFLLPGWQLCRRLDGKQWLTAGVGPVAVVVVVVGLFYLDCLMNAMLTSVMPLALGGLASASMAPAIARVTSPRRPQVRRPLTAPGF